MSPRHDPDAHLGPLAQAANRVERSELSRWMAIGAAVLAAAWAALAISDGGSVRIAVAMGWTVIAGLWWWRHRTSRRDEQEQTKGPDGWA